MREHTDAVIDRLARHTAVVTPLGSPWGRTVRWLGVSLAYLVLVLLLWPAEQALAHANGWRLAVEQSAALLTGVTAAVAAFATTVPGTSRRILVLPAAALSVWLLSVGEGCVRDLASHGAGGWSIGGHWPCLTVTMIAGMLPAAVLVVILRRGAPLTPRLTALLGGLAAAGLANFGVRFLHTADASVIVIVWHIGAVGLGVAAIAASGRRMFDWSTIVRRADAS
jgi:hypothetical protein